MVIVYLLAIYGIAFGMSQKFAPALFRLLSIPRAAWGGESAAEARNALPAWKVFFLRLFGCPYCTGFHAGWIGYLVATFLPEVVAFAFAGAALCYLLETIARRLES